MAEQLASIKHDREVNVFGQMLVDLREPMPHVDPVRRSFDPDYAIRLNNVGWAVAEVATYLVPLRIRLRLLDGCLPSNESNMERNGVKDINQVGGVGRNEILIRGLGKVQHQLALQYRM